MDRASVHIDLSYQFETDQQVVRNISKPTACDNFMSVMFHALFLAQVVASKILQGSPTYAISTNSVPEYFFFVMRIPSVCGTDCQLMSVVFHALFLVQVVHRKHYMGFPNFY